MPPTVVIHLSRGIVWGLLGKQPWGKGELQGLLSVDAGMHRIPREPGAVPRLMPVPEHPSG